MKRLIMVALLCLLISVTARGAQSLNGVESPFGQASKYIVTAYCPCQKCCVKTDKITSTGVVAEQGVTVAVDPKQIKYGSTVLIMLDSELVGIYIAEDCGGAIKGNRIDIYFDSHEDALDWGKKECEVIVLDGRG